MIYPSLTQSLVGMLKDDEDLEIYQNNYAVRLEQISIEPKKFLNEIREAVLFIKKNEKSFIKDIDTGVLIFEIEDMVSEEVSFNFFKETEIPDEIKGLSEEIIDDE